MKRIYWPPGRHVPTWSCFSKQGPIEYMNLKFAKVDWEREEFTDPFQHCVDSGGRQDKEPTVLLGRAREMLPPQKISSPISFDTDEKREAGTLRCVIIGRDKGGCDTSHQKHYVLVLKPFGMEAGVYERVGIASLLPSEIKDGGNRVRIV